MPKLDSTSPPDRDQELREAYRRIGALEIDIQRLTAEVLRLKAAGHDHEADHLEQELRERRSDVDRDRRLLGRRSEPADWPSTDQARDEPHRIEAATPSVVADETSIAADEESLAAEQMTVAAVETSDAPIVDTEEATKSFSHKKSRRRWAIPNLRKQPGWVASLVLHCLLLLLLALITFVSIQNSPPILSSGAIEGVDDLADELAEVSLDPVEIDEAMLSDAEFEALTPMLSELELDLPLASTELAAGPAVDAIGLSELLAMDAGALLTGMEGGDGEGEGTTAGGGSAAGEGEATFFGAKSRGNRFVFLIDNSGSMKDGRMETTFLELLKSVGAMKPDQMFYVVFYSDQAYPMFHPDPVDEMVPATRENKAKLEAWLSTVEMCTGGELNDALEMATELEPSAVYLLSDGEIYESRIRRLIESAEKRNYQVHTLGMTVRNQDHAANLVAIAEAHRGTFRPVGVSAAAVQMSRQRPIRYNREPGDVWGDKIRKW